jgi:hypothetical protein
MALSKFLDPNLDFISEITDIPHLKVKNFHFFDFFFYW